MELIAKLNDYIDLDQTVKFFKSYKGIALTIGGLGTGFVIYSTIKIYLVRRKYRHIPGPETKGIVEYFFGQHYKFAENIRKRSFFARLLSEWSNQYGPIIKFQLLNNIIVVSSDHELIKEIVLHKNYPKHPIFYGIFGFPFNERLLGNSLEAQFDHEKSKARRAVLNPFFQKKSLMEFLDEFNSRINLLIQYLNTLADGKTPIIMLDEINKTTLDLIGRIAFNLNNPDNTTDMKISKMITESMTSLSVLLNDPFSTIKPSMRSKIKQMKESVRELRKFSIEILKQRINDFAKKNYVPNDLLTIIVQNCGYKDGELDFDEMVDEFVDIYIAGQETTSNTLAFTVLQLGIHADVLKKLRQEIDNVIGTKALINNDDITKMVYLDCVFKESMRLWPTGSHLHREITDDLVFKDYRLPKGTWFILSPFVLHRSEKYFPRPEEFIPERFDKESPFHKENIINPYTYMPFSVGQRNCIGQNFARIQGKLILAKLVQNFEIRLDPTQNLGASECTTIRPADGCRVFLTPRDM